MDSFYCRGRNTSMRRFIPLPQVTPVYIPKAYEPCGIPLGLVEDQQLHLRLFWRELAMHGNILVLLNAPPEFLPAAVPTMDELKVNAMRASWEFFRRII